MICALLSYSPISEPPMNAFCYHTLVQYFPAQTCSSALFKMPRVRSSSHRDITPGKEKDKIIKRLTLSYGQHLFPAPDSPAIKAVPLTKAHFLDAYSKAKWNLSKVPRPACFEDTDVICPPDHYNEASRHKAAKKFSSCEQWKDTQVFNKLISKALRTFQTKGASISLVDSKRQIIKYQAFLNTTDIPRKISIDAHAILSNGSFVLLDASQDWRTATNPLVVGPPKIRFYAAVPLVTKFGSVIGAFAIFDEVPKATFDKKQVEELKLFAEEVMQHLVTPLKDISSASSNMDLINILGRPTSHGNQFLPVAVYEKDGSGSQYSQNYTFRYSSKETPTQWSNILVNEDIIRLVSQFRDVKSAANQLCRVIAEELHYSMVCVVEIRVSQKYQILSDYLPPTNVVNAESFRYASKLIGSEREQVISRLLGFYGYSIDPDISLDSGLFFGSLSSEFGILYEGAGRSSVKFKSGVCMPFYRIASKIIRKRKILRAEQSSNKGKLVDVYLRSGGYLICGFSEQDCKITEEQINFVYGAACTLRRLFIAN